RVAAAYQGRRARGALRVLPAGPGRPGRRNTHHVQGRRHGLPLSRPPRAADTADRGPHRAPQERQMPTSSTTLRTWSGAVSWTPQQVLRPISQEAVVAAVRAARAGGCALRVIGGGFSFSALAATDGITLSLDGYQGLVTAD